MRTEDRRQAPATLSPSWSPVSICSNSSWKPSGKETFSLKARDRGAGYIARVREHLGAEATHTGGQFDEGPQRRVLQHNRRPGEWQGPLPVEDRWQDPVQFDGWFRPQLPVAGVGSRLRVQIGRAH